MKLACSDSCESLRAASAARQTARQLKLQLWRVVQSRVFCAEQSASLVQVQARKAVAEAKAMGDVVAWHEASCVM